MTAQFLRGLWLRWYLKDSGRVAWAESIRNSTTFSMAYESKVLTFMIVKTFFVWHTLHWSTAVGTDLIA